MIRLTHEQTVTLRDWFLPERPGPIIGSHVIQTGNGSCLVDRWPDPRAIVVATADNYSFSGDAEALTPSDIQPHIKGFVEAPETFAPLLTTAFPDLQTWPRVIFVQQDAPSPMTTGAYSVRRLKRSDAPSLESLDPESAWISKTWGGPHGLAASGFAWGAFAGEQLVSVACTFFLGEMYEEIGVVTEPGFRGVGLSTACTRALCDDIRARGHRPSWTTSPDNVGSVRVAEKLGFTLHRHDVLYVIGIDIPQPADQP